MIDLLKFHLTPSKGLRHYEYNPNNMTLGKGTKSMDLWHALGHITSQLYKLFFQTKPQPSTTDIAVSVNNVDIF